MGEVGSIGRWEGNKERKGRRKNGRERDWRLENKVKRREGRERDKDRKRKVVYRGGGWREEGGEAEREKKRYDTKVEGKQGKEGRKGGGKRKTERKYK